MEWGNLGSQQVRVQLFEAKPEIRNPPTDWLLP